MQDCRGADGTHIILAALVGRGIDNQIDLAFLDQTHQIGHRLFSLIIALDHFHRHAVGFEHLGSPRSGDQRESEFSQLFGNQDDRTFVLVPHADKNLAAGRQRGTGADLRFGKGLTVAGGDAHDLAGRFHFRSQDDVHARKFGKRQHRFLDREVFHFRDQVVGNIKTFQLLADHHLGGNLGQRDPGGLADKRRGARSPRIDLQYEHPTSFNGILDVQQPAHVESQGDACGHIPDFIDQIFADRRRRQRAGRIPGMDPGILDVFHDPGDKGRFSVTDRVDINLDSVVDKLVDENRMPLGNLLGLLDKFQQRFAVINNLHGAAAQHVGRAGQHRVPDAFGDLHRLLGGFG